MNYFELRKKFFKKEWIKNSMIMSLEKKLGYTGMQCTFNNQPTNLFVVSASILTV